MKVSIILPCYNGARYLPECLDSVLAQTMTDFEAIIVDDGSKDDSAGIAERYAQMDARIRVFRQQNRGVSAARNLGLDHASGDWVTFVDCDDILPPDALETLLTAASADVVAAAHETFDETGKTEMVWPQSRWWAKSGEKRRRAAALRLIEGDCVLNIMCGKLIRRALIEREHLRLVEGLVLSEDALFNLEAVLAGDGICYVNRPVYRYRTHAQSAMGRQTGSVFEAHRPWLCAMQKMLKKRGLMEAYYAPFFDSAVLHLYKDGGVCHVQKTYSACVEPLIDMDGLDRKKMTGYGRLLLSCRQGYAAVYPFFWAVQTAGRKLGAAAAALRADREKPKR